MTSIVIDWSLVLDGKVPKISDRFELVRGDQGKAQLITSGMVWYSADISPVLSHKSRMISIDHL